MALGKAVILPGRRSRGSLLRCSELCTPICYYLRESVNETVGAWCGREAAGAALRNLMLVG